VDSNSLNEMLAVMFLYGYDSISNASDSIQWTLHSNRPYEHIAELIPPADIRKWASLSGLEGTGKFHLVLGQTLSRIRTPRHMVETAEEYQEAVQKSGDVKEKREAYAGASITLSSLARHEEVIALASQATKHLSGNEQDTEDTQSLFLFLIVVANYQLARMYYQYHQNEKEAISIWERIVKCHIGSPGAAVASFQLALLYYTNALNGTIQDAEMWISKLEKLVEAWVGHTCWESEDLIDVREYASALLGRWLLPQDEPDTARKKILLLVRLAIRELTDTVDSNCSCDGLCGRRDIYYRSLGACEICIQEFSCDECLPELKDNTLGFCVCSPTHPFVQIYPPRGLVRKGTEGYVVQINDDGEMLVYGWIAGIKKDWIG